MPATPTSPGGGRPAGPVAGQVALVTGASRGLGRWLALGLAGAGMHVGLLARDREALDSVATECVAAGAPGTFVHAGDVTDGAAVQAAVEGSERALGPIDLLVNNAGMVDPGETPPWEADPATWWRIVEANLRGPFLCAHAVLPGMVARARGRVVDVNSGLALRPASGYSAYAVSKAGLARLTDVLAHALDGTGVHVFDVSPGVVATDMTAEMPMHAGRTDWTDPQRVVDLVLALAAGRLDALRGQFLHAGRDSLADLLARAAAPTAGDPDTRRLRLHPFGPGDPLGA